MTQLALGMLAVVLAAPVPVLLGRARFLTQVPRAAVVLWQAVAVAAVLAALGAGLAFAFALVTPHGRPGGLDLGAPRILAHLVVLAFTAVVAARLGWALASHAHGVRAMRRRHRELVDLLADGGSSAGSMTADPAQVRVLGEPVPLAYCVPARGAHRVVLSTGTLRELGAGELAAVLAHERAHVRARHDLVVELFTAMWIAFPHGVRSADALRHVRTLIELLADDAARQVAGAVPMARALVRLADARRESPGVALGAAPDATADALLRLDRLAADLSPHRALAAGVYAAAAAVFVLPTAMLALPWLVHALEVLR